MFIEYGISSMGLRCDLVTFLALEWVKKMWATKLIDFKIFSPVSHRTSTDMVAGKEWLFGEIKLARVKEQRPPSCNISTSPHPCSSRKPLWTLLFPLPSCPPHTPQDTAFPSNSWELLRIKIQTAGWL